MEKRIQKEKRLRLNTRWKGLILAGLLSGCGNGLDQEAALPEGAEQSIQKRTITIQATELDTRRMVSQDPFPQRTIDGFPDYFGIGADPFERAGMPGYYLLMTGEKQWRIGSYMFVPQEVIAYEGEHLILEILGVRGSEHHTMLVGPEGDRVQDVDGNEIKFNVKRGELHTIEFTAAHSGLYQLICCNHRPTMTMNIHVLPR